MVDAVSKTADIPLFSVNLSENQSQDVQLEVLHCHKKIMDCAILKLKGKTSLGNTDDLISRIMTRAILIDTSMLPVSHCCQSTAFRVLT